MVTIGLPILLIAFLIPFTYFVPASCCRSDDVGYIGLMQNHPSIDDRFCLNNGRSVLLAVFHHSSVRF